MTLSGFMLRLQCLFINGVDEKGCAHNWERKSHSIYQKMGISAVCYYDKCEDCGIERHENSLYCDKVKWNPRDEPIMYNPN